MSQNKNYLIFMSTILTSIKKTSFYTLINKFVFKHFPKWQANRLYKKQFYRYIDWRNPTEFNEKLRWLQFNTDTSKWSQLADKYRVREYIKNSGYGDLLVKLYGVWDDAEKIDFNLLPKKFVIKTNNGCGSVFIVRDKTKINLEEIRSNLKKELSNKYGIVSAEPHYLKIKPVIIAEELLEQENHISSSLVDYKLYCVYGEPQFCGVMFNRDIKKHKYNVRLYDNDWNDISNQLAPEVDRGSSSISEPHNYDLMKKFCHEVCKEFPFVRMDFYECNGNLYFGEFTFTPAACTGGSLGSEACNWLSRKIDIKRVGNNL